MKSSPVLPARSSAGAGRGGSRLSAAGRGVAGLAAGVWLAMALVPPLTVAAPVLAAFVDAIDRQPV